VPESVTLDLPSARRVLTGVGAVVGLVALLVIGVMIGTRLLAPNPITGLATPGTVQQVGVAGGAVYVGRIVSSDGDYLRIAEPATIRQSDAAPGASAGPPLVVQALTVEPYDAAGELVVPISSVAWVTTVRPGSGLDTAYHQAVATVPGSSPAPTSP
jgi:hypothetical protein